MRENTFTTMVHKMHVKFGMTPIQVKWTDEEKDFRITCMEEELGEYIAAETKEDELDALLDLVVFAIGTADRQGMLQVFEEGFERVMQANCRKEAGPNKKRNSFALDLRKPQGWKAPDLSDLVSDHPQRDLFLTPEK